jgi:hypothetical protein
LIGRLGIVARSVARDWKRDPHLATTANCFAK